jgi:tetratricopeptide (TPR) repeat protein
VDFRSDIFSLGAVAYELICYQQAFPGSLDEGLLQRLPQMPPAPLASACPGLPPGLEEVVMRALAKAPLDRFTDLEEMRSAIRHFRAGVDPRLELETVVIPSRDKPKSSTPGSSSAERRGLLERRARQIAVHRDAARAALARGDLDSAAAACDDALTLDPDDAESTQLLAEIQQATEQRDQESKARRERERSIRQRVADAEVTLGRGDVASAARLLQEVFDEETRDPAALALLDKVRDAATAAGVTLPETLNIAGLQARTEAPVEVTRLSHRAEPMSVHEPERSRLPIYAAAAIVVIALGGGIVWMISGDRTTPATETTAPSIVPEPSNPPAATNASNATLPQAPSVTVAPAPATSPAPVPTPAPAPAATAPSAATDALASTVARIAKLQESGDVPGALAELTRIGPRSDRRASALAQSVAQSAFRSMAAAQDAAVIEKAESLAPVLYAEAEKTRSLANASQSRGDFVEAGTRAWNAAEAYRKATTEARAAALVAKAAAKTPPASPTATPEPPRRAEAPTAPPNPTPTVAPRPSALDAETPGILRALDRYKDAYSRMSVEELEKVYPTLPSEKREDLKDQFRGCRAFAVTFLKPQIGLTGDTTATVTVQATYSCTPKSRQSEQSFTVSDIFQLSKINDRWLIDGMGMMDNRRRR